MHRLLRATLGAFLIGLLFFTGEVGAADQADNTMQRPTLFIIGDSTVRNRTAGQMGWGDPIRELFDQERIRVENRALGGRSSRTFRTEGLWARVLEELRPGDYVLIQFGHNDGIAPDDPQRPRGSLRGAEDETQEIVHPHTGERETVRTYGWYIRQYVVEARERGATPIVLSYVPRCPRPGAKWPPELPVERASYALWAAEAAEAEEAFFVDLHGIVLEHYAQMTPEQIKAAYFCEADYTHTNEAGARRNAEAVVEGLRALEGCGLGSTCGSRKC
jgi:rhamnogalacturonan acetylesterase